MTAPESRSIGVPGDKLAPPPETESLSLKAHTEAVEFLTKAKRAAGNTSVIGAVMFIVGVVAVLIGLSSEGLEIFAGIAWLVGGAVLIAVAPVTVLAGKAVGAWVAVQERALWLQAGQ